MGQLEVNPVGPLIKASSSRGLVGSLVVGATVPVRGRKDILSTRATSTAIGDEKKVETQVWRKGCGSG